MRNGVDPVKIVEDGYDDIAHTYDERRDKFKNNALLAGFSALLPSGADVLDAGSGTGVPVTRFLIDAGFRATGVDISSRMLELGCSHVPEANFVKMDMRQLDFASGSFDGICAFYSLFHVPMAEHRQIINAFNRLLRPSGLLLFCSGRAEWEGIQDYQGAEMFWSHPDREATRQMVTDAGFTVLLSEVQELGGEEQYWVMARKSA